MIAQGTQDWFDARLGKVTASRAFEVIARTKKDEYTAERKSYFYELLSERLTGMPARHFVSYEMVEGTQNEPYGVAAYEMECDVDAQEMGWRQHPTIAMAGASPDRGIGEHGLLELKSPNSPNYLKALRGEGREKERYAAQCLWQLACCPEREWVDLVYYDPHMPIGLQIYRLARFTREESSVTLALFEKEVRLFLAELDAAVEEVRGGQYSIC